MWGKILLLKCCFQYSKILGFHVVEAGEQKHSPRNSNARCPRAASLVCPSLRGSVLPVSLRPLRRFDWTNFHKTLMPRKLFQGKLFNRSSCCMQVAAVLGGIVSTSASTLRGKNSAGWVFRAQCACYQKRDLCGRAVWPRRPSFHTLEGTVPEEFHNSKWQENAITGLTWKKT